MKNRKLTTAQLAVILSVMGLASKLLGFAREVLLANFYGAGYVTDAYVMSMSIPNNLLAAIVGAAATAYMPVFSKKNTISEDEGNRFTSQLINFLLLITGSAMVLGWIFARQLVSLLAPGFEGQTYDLCVYYLRVAFAMVVFSIFNNILTSYLEYKGRFFPTQVIGYFQNACIITVIILSAAIDKPKLLIYGITGGMLLASVCKLFCASQEGYRHRADFHFNESVKDVLALAIPVFIGGSTAEINTFVDRMLASGLPSGSVAALNYGSLFCNVITGFTVSIFVTIMYPRLTRAFADNNPQTISDIAQRGFSAIFILMVPLMLGSIMYGSPLIQVIYERGAFNGSATDLTAMAYKYYSVALVFTGIRALLDRIYYSIHDTVTPVICSVVSVVINIALNLILVKRMALGGLALATSIGQIVGTILLFALFEKKHPEIVLYRDWIKLAKCVVVSVLSVGASYAFYIFVGNAIWMPRMVLLGLAVLVAVVLYLIFLYILKFDDLKIITDIIGRNKTEA